jgi:hypothetical protein
MYETLDDASRLRSPAFDHSSVARLMLDSLHIFFGSFQFEWRFNDVPLQQQLMMVDIILDIFPATGSTSRHVKDQ